MFHHGFDHYMDIAFPADELKPVSCQPHYRDVANPMHIGVNDVLGGFALTAVDTLSTLAVLSHSSEESRLAFWSTVGKLEGFFNSTNGFDIDSTVQVFETTIRMLGGLLSAHLYATGEFKGVGIPPKGEYNGILLRLAYDLGERLLPAFEVSPTGIPAPRVNLRYGLRKQQMATGFNEEFAYQWEGSNWEESAFVEPFSKDFMDEFDGEESRINEAEFISETCSAGAGSLVLEFTVLSRLTGDGRFEEVAKKAFNAIWARRSTLDLIGGGIDYITGSWTEALSGIGAGIDSFFEYAFKSHILLSGDKSGNATMSEMYDSDYFLTVFDTAMEAIDRHLKVEIPTLTYTNVHLNTGALITNWIDSLSAYFVGLLANSGSVETATKLGLFYTSLWTRYAALPERFNYNDGVVEGGLAWWPGRPELVESIYFLYQATKDPWYLHVGEMIMDDIYARCKTRCGWTGLQNVGTGERSDRMESFMLGETAKYLYLLYASDHPLQRDDRAWVFSTEGHPLIIPKRYKRESPAPSVWKRGRMRRENKSSCPSTTSNSTGFFSEIAARDDLFHPAYLARLHQARPNLAIYPRTLPEYMIPPNATCSELPKTNIFDLVFPPVPATSPSLESSVPNITRVQGGLLLRSISNLRVSLLQLAKQYRVATVNSLPLGVNERIFIPRSVISTVQDPSFTVRWSPFFFKLEIKQTKARKRPPAQFSSDFTWPTDLRQLIHQSLSQLLGAGTDLPPVPTLSTSSESSLTAPALLAPNSRTPPDGETFTYFHTVPHTACSQAIIIPRLLSIHLEVLIIPRGGCTFSEKLSNIPSNLNALKMVLFYDKNIDMDAEQDLVRPLIDDTAQYSVALVGGELWTKMDEVLELVVWRMKGIIQVKNMEVVNWEVV